MKQNPMIRIGTLVPGDKAVPYIKQILPHGFESFQLTCWPNWGITDLKKTAEELKPVLEGSGAIIDSLGPFGNPLMDPATAKAFEQAIDAAEYFGATTVCGFAGRITDKPIPESIPKFKEVFGPLAKRAADKGIKIGFENCPMGGDWSRGDWNIAHNPMAWELMFDALGNPDHVGLEWEPCHQMGQLIDPMAQLRQWSQKIVHVHGKDSSIYWDIIKKEGIGGGGPRHWFHHRTPGFGDTNWTDIISELLLAGYRGSIDIEGWHDNIYKDALEMTGQVHGLNYLKSCRPDYTQNPQ
ncbi:MAG: sugar phosphate isomerase/epimerase [Verrucomicrobiota bacterium]|nr:sugar phosphate isomerase/epimerase [Verrucomicrobiota bacterium]